MDEAKSGSAAPREFPDRRKHERPPVTVEEIRLDLHRRIEVDFRYHMPAPGQAATYELIRANIRALAHMLVDNVPPGRELSRSITHLEDAMMIANAGIARGGAE